MIFLWSDPSTCTYLWIPPYLPHQTNFDFLWVYSSNSFYFPVVKIYSLSYRTKSFKDNCSTRSLTNKILRLLLELILLSGHLVTLNDWGLKFLTLKIKKWLGTKILKHYFWYYQNLSYNNVPNISNDLPHLIMYDWQMSVHTYTSIVKFI